MTGTPARFAPPLRAMREAAARPDLRRLLFAYSGFNVAEWSTWIAMLVFAYRAGGVAATGLVAAIQLIPAAILAPFAGAVGDRLPRERVLLGGYLLQAASMGATGAAILGSAPVVLVYGLAALAATSIVVTRPAQGGLLPNLSRTPEELTAGYAGASIVEGVSTFVGPALSGLVIGLWGPGWVFVGSAAWLVLSAIAVARIRTSRQPVEHTTGVLRDAATGLASLVHRPAARLLVGVSAAHWVVWGTLDVLIVVLSLGVLGTGQAGVGYLNAALGLGGLAGGVATVALVGRRRLSPAILIGAALWGVPIALTAFASAPVVAGCLLVLVGLGHALIDVAGRTQLQRVVPDDVLSRILGVEEATTMAGLAIGSVLAPVLVSELGSRGALVAAGSVLPALGVVAWRGLGRADLEARVPTRETGLLRGLSLFAPLSLVDIERLAANLRPVEVPAGTAVIREGDPGDRFYIVDEGELAVDIAGRRAAALGSGDGFGEIALLRDVPRTATVVALVPSRLFSLDRGLFLEVVTGHPASAAAGDELIERRLGESENERRS